MLKGEQKKTDDSTFGFLQIFQFNHQLEVVVTLFVQTG